MADQQLNDIEAQKAALLASIAQQGSQGQQAFAAEQARRQAAQQAAVGQVVKQSQMTGVQSAAPAGATAELAKQQGDLGAIYAQDAAMSGQTFKNSIANTAAANAAYMNAAGAALPIVQAQTAGQVAQIRAEQEAAAAERAQRLEEMRLEAAEAQKERDFAQQEREAASKDERTALEEEAEMARKDDVLQRARAKANRVTEAALNEIVSSADTIEEAVALAPRIINEAIALAQDGNAGAKVWTAEDRKDLYRYLYEFFSGEKAPVDPNELADAYAKGGVKVTDIPGYVPPADRQKRKMGGISGPLGQIGSPYQSSSNGETVTAGTPMTGRTAVVAAKAIGGASGLSSDEIALLVEAIERKGRPPRDAREARSWVQAEIRRSVAGG